MMRQASRRTASHVTASYILATVTARRSSRTSSGSAADISEPLMPASDISDYASSDFEDADEVRPVRKRQKKTVALSKTAGAVKKTGGHLKMLAEMPVDVLLEIFSHLHPVDVLHLAWTSKELRQVLMRRSAISVWRGAFDAVPHVPECPDDQSLPQWARLLFVSHCHLCLAPSVTTVLFALRMRACQKCLSRTDIFTTNLGNYIDLYLPHVGVTEDNFPCVSNHMKLRTGSARSQSVYLLAQVMDTKSSCHDVLKHGQDAFKAFLAEKKKMIDQIKLHAIVCDRWYEGQREERADELSSIRSERWAEIVEKLKQLGYQADIDNVLSHHRHNDDFESLALFRKSQKLTPEIWSNIQQTVLDYFLEFRPRGLEAERVVEMMARGKLLKAILAKYRRSLPAGIHIPPDGEIANATPFLAVWDVDPHSRVCARDFDEALTAIPRLFEPWSQAVDSTLLKILETSEPSILQLATTTFLCTGCRGPLLTRDVRRHACLVSTVYTYHAAEERERLLYHFYNALGSAPWNQRGVLHVPTNKTIRPCVEELARASGLDPVAATPADMDAVDATFTCVWCVQEARFPPGQKPMKWFTAVKHHLYHAWSDIIHGSGRTTARPAHFVVMEGESGADGG